MKIRFAFALGFLAALLPLVVSAELKKAPKPNVVVLFVDDMGYGDSKCFKTIFTTRYP